MSAPARPLRPGSLGACCSWHRELVLPLPWLAQTGLRLRPSQSPAPSHRLAYFPPSSLAGKFNRHTDTWDAVQQQGYFSLEAFTHMLSQAGAVALCCCVTLQPTSCWHQHAGTHVQPGKKAVPSMPALVCGLADKPGLCSQPNCRTYVARLPLRVLDPCNAFSSRCPPTLTHLICCRWATCGVVRAQQATTRF